MKTINTFYIKLIAIFCMTIDHIAALFLKNPHLYLICRTIGAVTFPIMAYMICEGYNNTKNLLKYKKRLFVFSLVSMIPYALAFGYETLGLNVGFTLLFGLFSLEVLEKTKNSVIKWVAVFILSVISFNFDWGFVGVWMIVAFYYAKKKKEGIFLSLLLGVLLFVVKNQALYFLLRGELLSIAYILKSSAFIRHFGFLLAGVLIIFYNGQHKGGGKWLFYVYYPTHLLALGLIQML
mgnify:CR=1 FL=1